MKEPDKIRPRGLLLTVQLGKEEVEDEDEDEDEDVAARSDLANCAFRRGRIAGGERRRGGASTSYLSTG